MDVDTTTLDRIAEVSDQSQLLGQLLDWLNETAYCLATPIDLVNSVEDEPSIWTGKIRKVPTKRLLKAEALDDLSKEGEILMVANKEEFGAFLTVSWPDVFGENLEHNTLVNIYHFLHWLELAHKLYICKRIKIRLAAGRRTLTIPTTLARYFDIDENKAEQERRALLEACEERA